MADSCISRIVKPLNKELYDKIDFFVSHYDYDKVFSDEFLKDGYWAKENGHENFMTGYRNLEFFSLKQRIASTDSIIYLYDYPIQVAKGDLIIEIESDPRSVNDHAIDNCSYAEYVFKIGATKYIFEENPLNFYTTGENLKINLRNYDDQQSNWDSIMNTQYYTWIFIVRNDDIVEAYIKYICGDDGCYPAYDLIMEKNVVKFIWCDRKDRRQTT